MGSLGADSTTVNNWREHPPSYSLKINKLSQLTLDKYESRWFFPVDTTGDWLYTQKETKRTMEADLFQYVEVKRFNALRTVWGLSQVLSLKRFNDHVNGYIFEGEQCEFGVDVMIASPFTKWEVVSFDDKLSYPKFSWSVKNFSVLKENLKNSKSFSMGGRKWYPQLYPKGDSRADGKWLSIFLSLDGSETLKAEEKIYLRAYRPAWIQSLHKAIDSWYTNPQKVWGFSQGLSLAKLRETYLDLEDTLIVESEFEVVSVTKYST